MFLRHKIALTISGLIYAGYVILILSSLGVLGSIYFTIIKWLLIILLLALIFVLLVILTTMVLFHDSDFSVGHRKKLTLNIKPRKKLFKIFPIFFIVDPMMLYLVFTGEHKDNIGILFPALIGIKWTILCYIIFLYFNLRSSIKNSGSKDQDLDV